MKKQILFSAIALMAGSTLLFNGCKKDDTTAPVVTVSGGSSRTVSLNGSISDPGATADDGSTVTSNWSSTNPNFNLTGDYNITYTATDGAGNTGTATLTVTVKNDADSWTGTYLKTHIVDSVYNDAAYSIPHSPPTYTWTNDMVVTASTTVNNRIYFHPFNDYPSITSAEKIYGNVTGSVVTIPAQVAHSIGSPAADHTFQGDGAFGSYLSLTGIRLRVSDQFSSITAYDVVYFVK
jgi:hypothetical protein